MSLEGGLVAQDGSKRTENVTYPLSGTCDACGQGQAPLRSVLADDTNCAWICRDCDEWHEKAVDAAYAKVQELRWVIPREAIAQAVKAFCEYDGPHPNDAPLPARGSEHG